MRTLPREPWRGGQICGWQMEYGTGREVYCGEFKAPRQPVCTPHVKQLREVYGGSLSFVAPGNALGLAAYRQGTMPYMFQLAWEPDEGDTPIPATEEEIAAWEAS